MVDATVEFVIIVDAREREAQVGSRKHCLVLLGCMARQCIMLDSQKSQPAKLE